MSELPEGWTTAGLTEVCQLNPGKPRADSLTAETEVSFVPMAAVDADLGVIAAPVVRSYASVSKGFTTFQNGDVILAKITPCMENGKAAIARDLVNGVGFGSTEFHVFRPSVAALPDYIFYFIRQASFRKSAEANMTGSVGQKRVPASFLNEVNLPLPPLNEQRRIVAKLEKLLSRVDAAQARLATIPRILKRFRQSVLAAACLGKLTTDWRNTYPKTKSAASLIEHTATTVEQVRTRRGVPEHVEQSEQVASFELPASWALASTAELLRAAVLLDVKDGNHGANHPKVADFTPEGLSFITAAQVKNYEIDYEGAPKISGKPLEELRVGFAEVGDAVLTHKGSVGRAALNTRACVLTPQTTYYRCNADILLPSYLVYYFTSWQFFVQLSAVMSQTTRDFVPISEQYNLFIIVPPTKEQQEIVRRVEALFKTAAALEARYRMAKAHVDKLTQSILARAFRGQLVTTEAELARLEGRDYEPASVLLERIRQERARQQPTSAKSKTRAICK